MNAIEEVRKTIDGIHILQAWFGEDGYPVEQDQANRRALVCENCPENRGALWWEKFSKDPIAQVIRIHLETKQKAKLTVPNEDNLHMCRICGCCLMLKVHVPIRFVAAHLNQEQLNRFPDYCWIKKETLQ